MLPRSSGTFSPSPSTGIQTGFAHPTQGSLNASAGASPSTSSPTGNYGLSKIAVAQVSVLLSTLKTKKDDPVEYDNKVDRLKKLINDHGMEVFSKFFTKLVHTTAPQIFPGLNRPIGSAGNAGSYTLLQDEMCKISHEVDQASMIANSIETGTEDIFRDFDVSTFMEHFRLDALEKTILALAFKMGTRPDLKTKADAILSTNYPTFVNIISQPDGDHSDLSPEFLAVIVDRLIQYHPPNFNPAAHRDLATRIESRYAQREQAVPLEVLAALDLYRVLVDTPSNTLALYIQRVGPDFTRDEEACVRFLQDRPAMAEEQVSNAIWYTTISQLKPEHKPSVLVAALRRVVPPGFRWPDVVSYFDQPTARISPPQFLRLYRALLPLAHELGPEFDIQRLWGGVWANPEAQMSFLCAFFKQPSEELDATTIPGLRPSFTLAEYAQSTPIVQEFAERGVRQPLVSLDALSAVFEVALSSLEASSSIEAKRLFNDAVIPNLHLFFVSALGVPKPWPQAATDTISSLLDNFFFQCPLGQEFVLDSVWRKDKDFVKQRLTDKHAGTASELPSYYNQLEALGWLDDFTHDFNGFGLDLVTYGHGEGRLDLEQWLRTHAGRTAELASHLLRFLLIKAKFETDSQRPAQGMVSLKVKTVFSLLNVLAGLLPPDATTWILCQRQCITAYPRVINYGGDFDDIIDANGKDGNQLGPEADARMQEHFKSMYNDNEMQVRDIVETLDLYKHSRNPLDQDIFACMIQGLFDEYAHFITYPIAALATTAVLFGGVLSRKLIDAVPLNVGLGMVLESVRDFAPDHNMYKFGLQALMQLHGRFPEWPGFCRQLLQVPSLQRTDIWPKAESVVNEEEAALQTNGGHEVLTNGNAIEPIEPQFAPFTSINVEPPSPGIDFEDPGDDDQDKIQFALNNIDQSSLRSRFDAIRESVERRHQQWFAIHLVQERAKMQPNLHQMYLELVKLFEDNALWAEIQRATLVCLHQILNSESTMHSSTERAHLKNLGGWLGMLTLARDKPIRHSNIAFKQLLIEAHDTKRLVVVIPFVCKVLDQGKNSTVFRPPNPWLMDIIHLLIELYHHADIKLNQKFEIEVLCKNLNLDHKSIEPSGEILNRVMVEDLPQVPSAENFDFQENMSLNGLGQGIVNSMMPQIPAPAIPDLSSRLIIPPTNEMVVNNNRLRDIVDRALKQALTDIIQPVVDRSVTIAAISTQQMIHKDFATEPDENRVRNSAVNMVKATAGSLALVTSKEPLRANFTNQMRQLSVDIPGGLPEGTIIMCVNSNLELASSVIEDAAERRAIPEIEEMIEPELEARRRHRLSRPNQPYVDASLTRWAMTMPDPYKMAPSMTGLNADQMAIYEEFARQPRPVTTATPSHIASTSDATRSIANEILSDQYSSAPGIPTPAETPSLSSVTGHAQVYSQGHTGLMNGRQPTGNAANAPDPVLFSRRVRKLVEELKHAATEAPEEHYDELPRELSRGQQHPVLNIMDELSQLIIGTVSTSDEFPTVMAEVICEVLLGPGDDNLTMETFAKLLQTLRRITNTPQVSDYAKNLFQRQEATRNFLRLPLIKSFMGTEFLDWRTLDEALARYIRQKDHQAMQLLSDIVQMTIVNDMPVTFFANLGISVEAAYGWILEEPEGSRGEHLKSLLEDVRAQQIPPPGRDDRLVHSREQMDYVFDEWVSRYRNTALTEKLARSFIKQIQEHGIVRSKEDFFLFIRTCLDNSVAHFEQALHVGVTYEDAYVYVDALAVLVVDFVKWGDFEDRPSPTAFLESIWALVTMLVNWHTVKHGEMYNQRVFFRFFSDLIFESKAYLEAQETPQWADMLLRIAARLNALGPNLIPGFVYGWMALLHHRAFLPEIMKLDGEVGWPAYTKLIKQLLDFAGEALKPVELPEIGSKLYEASAKLLIVLQHDYPEYVAANAAAILPSIPPHCAQLINTVLMAGPPNSKPLDPFTTSMDAIDGQDQALRGFENPIAYLQSIGLLDILNSALENGPSEDAVAHMTHAIMRAEGTTGFANASVGANIAVIDAITSYIGNQGGQQPFDPSASSVATLSMVLHEVTPEARHYLILSMVNHLRRSSPDMQFYNKFILQFFDQNLSDPEEMEILEQITRVLLERVIGFSPQPWGLINTVRELVMSDKHNFFDLPFIKATPDVRSALQQRGLAA